MYDGLPPVSDYIARFGLAARRSLGQNFILDLNLADRIARQVPGISDSVVVEVGSGPGGLTRALLKNGAGKVVAVEVDRRAIGLLEELRSVYKERLEIVKADAMGLDYSRFAGARLCSNLPYNISVPLLAVWLKGGWFESMTLMFQREVAARIVASSGKDYGRISILVALTYRAKVLFGVPGSAFFPPPKVDSSVVGFARAASRPSPEVLEGVEVLVSEAFSHRRKMLRGSLKSVPAGVLERLGLSPVLRAGDVSPEDWLRIASGI
ncbi:MAG: 16S rRNA (adenine(1518)-N(6)/adenine(1519)-N(6))-dimethyltransferase RsmA [Rickettsiales bacterium]|jgi:16S rRNA (adenine1518-N6/adenine1519-N6)-dimethyltransferase|nr:16S rRNA (adenine(1518)-N(6)/adenine(1519)-N(6))-dimethyltransferase RsmA [Rickettsiales bacterium]